MALKFKKTLEFRQLSFGDFNGPFPLKARLVGLVSVMMDRGVDMDPKEVGRCSALCYLFTESQNILI